MGYEIGIEEERNEWKLSHLGMIFRIHFYWCIVIIHNSGINCDIVIYAHNLVNLENELCGMFHHFHSCLPFDLFSSLQSDHKNRFDYFTTINIF